LTGTIVTEGDTSEELPKKRARDGARIYFEQPEKFPSRIRRTLAGVSTMNLSRKNAPN
jgi:hypothetical protein